MVKRSAGLLLYRRRDGMLEVFLIHPGGPMWAKKDHGAWALPKGEYKAGEAALDAAKREFEEETGFVSAGPYHPLREVTQKGGKIVTAWAFEGDCDPDLLVSNLCRIEWPPRSGKKIEVPEVDRGRWFSIAEARKYVRPSHEPFLDRLVGLVGG